MGRIVRRRDPRSSETADWIRRLIIGSPIYNGLLGSPLKNLFEHVQGQLVALMNYFQVLSNPRAVYAFDEHFEAGDRSQKGKLKDKAIERRVKRLVDETVAMFKEEK